MRACLFPKKKEPVEIENLGEIKWEMKEGRGERTKKESVCKENAWSAELKRIDERFDN